MSIAPTMCTIIAKNYLAYARALCTSFLTHHPGGKCYVLIVDEWLGFIDPAAEQFTIVSLSDIGLPERRDIFCFQYNVTELSTAVKPFFLRWLIESRGETCILYLDPDIFVTASLEPLYQRLATGSGVLVTPHLDRDYPRDGKIPDDRWVMFTGAFNLGFLGVTAKPLSLDVLRWLEEKLIDRCVQEPEIGYFVDQRFFDLAITLFPSIEIERGIGYNVAYWNLHSRFLTAADNGTWLVNGELLRFFHFSNYKPSQMQLISRHMDRYLLKDRPDLQPLFETYNRLLMDKSFLASSKWPYTYGQFANGQKISDFTRRTFRLRIKQRRHDLAFKPFESKRLSRQSVIFDLSHSAFKALQGLKGLLGRMLAGERSVRNS